MANKNDDRIMGLKQRIAAKTAELDGKPNKFVPITNCVLTLDRTTYNIRAESSVLLLAQLNTWRLSAIDLGIAPETIIISGFSLTDWITDVKSCLDVMTTKAEKRRLDAMTKQLDALLSDDKQTELKIDDIEAML